jgi:HlyD family secretion protein
MPHGTSSRPNSKRRVAWGLLAAAVVAGGSALGVRASMGTLVTVAHPVRREVVQTVVSSGRVLAPTEVTLAALAPGSVTHVLVSDGDSVQPGQLLAKIDDRELSAAVKQAEAAVARARAGTVQVKRLSLPAARERLRQAELSLAQAQRTFSRDDELFRKGSITATSLEQSKTLLDVAESQKSAAELQVESVTGGGSEGLAAAAALEQAKAQVVAARAALDRAHVVSPLAGVVLERHVDPGDSVQPGMRLFVVSSAGKTRLVMEPDERNLALLRVGQPALASAEAFPKERFAATVGFIAPSVDAQRGTIEVRLDVPAPPPYLKPDMTVSIETEVARKAGALTIPSSALHDLATEHPWALVVVGGRAERREVEVGVVGDGTIEATRGLAESDAVIVRSPSSVKPGSRVRAVTSAE